MKDIDFKWTADLVKDFCEYAGLRIGKKEDIREQLNYLIEDFKASHTEVKRDWEIVSFIEKDEEVEEGDEPFILPVSTIPSCYKLEMYLEADSCFNIHSVKRTIDGEVFTLGDNCFHGPIVRFNLRDNQITADFEYGDVGCSKLLSELSKPLQRTPLSVPSDKQKIQWLEDRVAYIEKILKIDQ